MKPTIVEIGHMVFVGMHCRTTLKTNMIPQLWDNYMPRMSEVQNIVNPETGYGICFYENITDFTNETPFSYMACQEVSDTSNIPKEMSTREIAPAKYALFTHKGPVNTLQETYLNIYNKWLPEGGFIPAKADMFELYDERFKFGEATSEMDIYIPIE